MLPFYSTLHSLSLAALALSRGKFWPLKDVPNSLKLATIAFTKSIQSSYWAMLPYIKALQCYTLNVKVLLFNIITPTCLPPKVATLVCRTCTVLLHAWLCVCCIAPQCWVPHVHAGSRPVGAYGPIQSPTPECLYRRAKPGKKPYQQLKIPQPRGPAYAR